MPSLLVSVRSPDEAVQAVAGGAAIIDVKEPSRGPLGRADAVVWRSILNVLPIGVPASVALGELPEWRDRPDPDPGDFSGLTFRKLGLAGVGSGPEWRAEWAALRGRWGPGPAWVAVVYSDWAAARAPHPNDVLDEALAVPECTGVLIDTWDKCQPSAVDDAWRPWFERARRGGLRLALAGGLDLARIDRLAALAPDWFAVRGAACRAGERGAAIDVDRVARLARLVASLPAD